jgi:hypothetical protein
VDPRSDVANCGACGKGCVAPEGGTVSCAASACQVKCGGRLSLCDGACVDTRSDAAHCGGCGDVCFGTLSACLAGVCLSL